MTDDTGLKNNTDYEFPEWWGMADAETKAAFYTRERVWRQFNRQRRVTEPSMIKDGSYFKVDEELE